MKVDVFDVQGNPIEKIELPKVFKEPLREDLIRRAFLAVLSSRRQPYATDVMAGKRTSAHYHGYRRHRWTMMSREMARMPRLHGKIPMQQMFRPRFVPQATKGREAHPPIVEKIWELKINKKERQKAVRSAIAATAVKELLLERGHDIGDVKGLPIIVNDRIQELNKAKDLAEFFKKIGLGKELERVKERKFRRGRYKRKVGPLVVVAENKGVSKAARNLGIDVCLVRSLSVADLAPGAVPGRLTIWSESSIKGLGGK